MRRLLILFLATTSALHAADDEGLRLLSPNVDTVIRVPSPRKAAEALLNFPAVRDGLKLPGVAELLQSADLAEAFEVVRYFESKLGKPWPELLDAVAGRGLTFGLTYDGNTTSEPALLAIQGTNAAASEQFMAAVVGLIDDRLARLPTPLKLQKSERDGLTVYHLGTFFLTRRDTDILVASHKKALEHALASAKLPAEKTGAGNATLRKARALFAPDALAWASVNPEWLRKLSGVAEAIQQPRADPIQTVFFGGILDALRRAEAFGLGLEVQNSRLTLSARAAVAGQPSADAVLHTPAAGPGLPPPLRLDEPFAQHAVYFDFGALVTHADKILTPENAKNLREAGKQLSKVLPGGDLEKLLNQLGPQHRLVYGPPIENEYGRKPKAPLGSVAVVSSMRDREFGRQLPAILRGVNLLIYGKFKTVMEEETADGLTLLVTRFGQKGDVEADPDGVRFNFTPTFVAVGDHAVFASNKSLALKVAAVLKTESPGLGTPAHHRLTVSAPNVAKLVVSDPAALAAQLVLGQGAAGRDAKELGRRVADWLAAAGTLEYSAGFDAGRYTAELSWQLAGANK